MSVFARATVLIAAIVDDFLADVGIPMLWKQRTTTVPLTSNSDISATAGHYDTDDDEFVAEPDSEDIYTTQRTIMVTASLPTAVAEQDLGLILSGQTIRYCSVQDEVAGGDELLVIVGGIEQEHWQVKEAKLAFPPIYRILTVERR
jgi:hypothetical protein